MNFTNEKLFKILKSNIILILACGVLCFGIAYAFSKFYIKPVYYSNSEFTIKSQSTTEIKTAAELTFARSIVATYIEILDTNNFFRVVHDGLPYDIKEKYSVEQIHAWTSFAIQENTEIINVHFTCPDERYAKQITSRIVSSVPDYFNKSSYIVSCWTTEDASDVMLSSNKTVVYSVFGFIFGMALVYIIAILREALDTRVKTVKDLVERYDLPVLGSIPAFKGKVIKKEDN